MKKILTLIVAFALSVTMAFAQTGSGKLLSSPTHVPTDTVVNTATKNQSIAVGIGKVATIQTTLTKISGTAAGVVRLFGSLDNVNWVRVNPTDSLTMTDVATKTKAFVVTPGAFTYYRIGYTGVGTMSVKLNSQAAWRKD